jgi:translation initiation factor 2 subunit 2
VADEEKPAEGAEEFDFGKKKSKKKKRPDLAQFEAQLMAEGGEGSADVSAEAAGSTESGSGATDEEPWLGSNRDYTYQEVRKIIVDVYKRHLG